MLTTTNNRAFFLARDFDSVFEVDPSCGTPSAKFTVHDFGRLDPVTGVRQNANPHDIAAAPDGTLVIPLYNVPELLFVKDGAIAHLDLSSYDPDRNPQAESVRVVTIDGAAKAFVTLERLDDRDTINILSSKQSSLMLRVDVATRTVEATTELAGRNPFNAMAELGGALFLAEPGNVFSATDDFAGIERFDTATSRTRLLLTEADLGASVMEVAVTDGCGAAIVAGPEKDVNPTSVVTFDPESGRVIAGIQAPLLGPTENYDLRGLAWRGRNLYVGDRRRGATGFPVRIFEDRGGCTLVDTNRRIDLPRPPITLRAAASNGGMRRIVE
jgi:hypothetical protein